MNQNETSKVETQNCPIVVKKKSSFLLLALLIITLCVATYYAQKGISNQKKDKKTQTMQSIRRFRESGP